MMGAHLRISRPKPIGPSSARALLPRRKAVVSFQFARGESVEKRRGAQDDVRRLRSGKVSISGLQPQSRPSDLSKAKEIRSPLLPNAVLPALTPVWDGIILLALCFDLSLITCSGTMIESNAPALPFSALALDQTLSRNAHPGLYFGLLCHLCQVRYTTLLLELKYLRN